MPEQAIKNKTAIDGTDGRVQLVSNIVGCLWEDVKVGMTVKVQFDDVTPEVTLAKFKQRKQSDLGSLLSSDIDMEHRNSPRR